MKQITFLRYSFRYSLNLSRNIMTNNILISKSVYPFQLILKANKYLKQNSSLIAKRRRERRSIKSISPYVIFLSLKNGVLFVLARVVWVACLRGWCAIIVVIVVIEVLSWSENVECLLYKQKWKTVPDRSEQWFKRRTWLEEQVLLYIFWTDNERILNMSETQCGQICLDMCNFVNICEYVWNITCLNKPEF